MITLESGSIETRARATFVACLLLVFVIFGLLVWRTLSERATNLVLYDYHLASATHAATLEASYAEVRRISGIRKLTASDVVDIASFTSASLVEYRHISDSADALFRIAREFPDPDMEGTLARIQQATARVATAAERDRNDPFAFSLALANEEFGLDIASQQLGRLHLQAFERKRTEFQARQRYADWAIAALMALLATAAGVVGWQGFHALRKARAREQQNLQALTRSTAQLNEAQRMAKIGAWELDLVTNRLEWSDEIFRLFGIDKHRFGASYEAFLEAIHPEDREAVNIAYTESLKNRAPYQIVHRLRMSDGRIKWVRETCETFFDPTGTPLRSVGTVQDITELHEAELELRKYRDKLEAMVRDATASLREAQRVAHLGTWSIDSSSGTFRWSEEVFAIHGLDKNSAAPDRETYFRDILHPDDRVRVQRERETAGRSGIRAGVDYRIRRPDGTERWVYLEGVVETSADGAVSSYGIMQDITERKRAEAALVEAKEFAEKANRAKSEFLSRMSHELRTPMNAILGFAQILEVERLNPEQLDFVREIHRAGDHLLELINELLDLARIESGKLAAVLQPVNVGDAVTEALQMTQTLVTTRRISVINRCSARGAVLADPTRLRQILVNLISNAVKYNRTGGHVLVDCQARGADVLRISVTDTGPGIASEKLELLFKPFERLGAEFGPIDGTGIGLSLSKQLAELMGGQLGVDTTLGEGSTFWLDVASAPFGGEASHTPAPEAAVENGDRTRILYIEDNAANLRVVEAMFRRQAGLALLSASNGEFGIDLARRYRPDAILLDIHLPGMDGYAVLDVLRADESLSGIPVIALSADAMPIDIETGLRAGFVRYLTKPVKVESLLEAVDAALALRRHAQDHKSVGG